MSVNMWCCSISLISFPFLAGYIFYEQYEENILGRESGARVSDDEPFCGRYSLKNPTIIWRAGYSAFSIAQPQDPYAISRYKQVSDSGFPFQFESVGSNIIEPI